MTGSLFMTGITRIVSAATLELDGNNVQVRMIVRTSGVRVNGFTEYFRAFGHVSQR
jgi:hypothetical protein